MPEFHLNTGGAADAQRFAELPKFTRGYIEAMFFTECEQGGNFDPENGSPLPQEAGFSDLAPETLADIVADCERFVSTLPRDDNGVTDLDRAGDVAFYDLERAGNDFWCTRNGHGTGFWDRGLDYMGDRLTAHAKKFGEVWVYLGDDERVYIM